MIFQIVFFALTSAVMFYFLVATRSTAWQKLFLLAFFGTGLGFILFPESSNRLASIVGIGRGADLIIYVSILFLFFLCFNFYFRFRLLEAHLSTVTRELAKTAPLQEGGRESDKIKKG